MIKVQNLTKKFGELRAVDNVSFAVEQGDILGFFGPKRRRENHLDAYDHRLHLPHIRLRPDRRR